MRIARALPAVAAAAAGSLFVTAAVPAGAAATGVGSSSGALSVLDVDLGSLLTLDVLTDQAAANTNSSAGELAASAQVLAAKVTSPAAGLSQEIPLVSVKSTGAKQTQSQAITPIANPVVNGAIAPIDLSALLDTAGAVSGISAGLGELDLLGGVLSATATDIGMTSQALPGQSDALRGVDIDALTVLDLESFLAGLGINLADLPVDTALGLVDALGLLPQLDSALTTLGIDADLADLTDLESLVDTLGTQITTLQGLTTDLNNSLCDTADPAVALLAGLLGQVPADLCADIAAALAANLTTIADLIDQLSAVLGTVIDLLDGTALLSVQGVEATVLTKALETVDASAATVTASLGGIKVGQLEIPGVDLLATAAQVNSTISQIESALGGVLGTVDPSLANVLDIHVLESTKSITQAAGAVTSQASLTALRVDLNLPDLSGLVSLLNGLGALDSIGDQVLDLGGSLPPAAQGVLDLNQALAGLATTGIATPDSVLALSEGGTIRVASVNQSSVFSPRAALPTQSSTGTPANTSLPRTGGESTTLLMAGAVAALGALVLRRTLRSAKR